MANLWFPVEELISDRVDRARKRWDDTVGKNTRGMAAQVAEPLLQDRIGSALSRFDTLSAGPARGLLSGPSGPLTAANPIAAGSAIGADLFPEAAPGIAERARLAGDAFEQRLRDTQTVEPPPKPRAPIETPGLGLEPLGQSIEDRIGRARTNFASLVDPVLGGLRAGGDRYQQLGRDQDRSTGMPGRRPPPDVPTRPSVVEPIPLDPGDNFVKRGLQSGINESVIKPYNWIADPGKRQEALGGLAELGKVIGPGMTMSGESTLPTSRTAAPRVAETRTAVKNLDPEKVATGIDVLGTASNFVPGLAGWEDVAQNIAVPVVVEGAKDLGIPEPWASVTGLAVGTVGPLLFPALRSGAVRFNKNVVHPLERGVGEAMGAPGGQLGELAPGVLSSTERSRAGAMQQVVQQQTGKYKDGVRDAFPFTYVRKEVKGSKAQRALEYASSMPEAEAMLRLDKHPEVESWTRPHSEADLIPYTQPHNGETGSYLPDFSVKYTDGKVEIIEIKAAFRENTPAVQARSEAARQWATDRGYAYVLVTENDLGRFSLKARTLAEADAIKGFSPHQAQLLLSRTRKLSRSIDARPPMVADPTRPKSRGLAGSAVERGPGVRETRGPAEPVTQDDLEILEQLQQAQRNLGNHQAADRTEELLTRARESLGMPTPGGVREQSASDLSYDAPGDGSLPGDEANWANREMGKAALIRGGIGAGVGAASGAAEGEREGASPEDRAKLIGVGALAGGATGVAAHAVGYQSLSKLIDAGKISPQYLQAHPDLANRVRAVMLAAAERTPAGQPVPVPTAVQSLSGLSMGNGGQGLTPELLHLTSGKLTGDQIRDLVGRSTPLSRVWQASKDLIADTVSGLPMRFSRAEEYRADRGASLFNLNAVGVERATSVEDLVRRVADAVGTATPNVSIVNSPDVNAFAPVNGRPLQLTTGLMQLGLSKEELAWVIAHELVHTTTEGRSRRMQWMVSRAIEKNGKAGEQAEGGLAQQLAQHNKAMQGRLEHFDTLGARLRELDRMEESRAALAATRTAGTAIERPPAQGVWAEWGGKFTDNDLMEIAVRSGDVQSFGPQWWEAVDPRVVKEYKAEVMAERGGKYGEARRANARSKGSLAAEKKRVQLEHRAVEQQLEQDLNIQSNLEEQAAQQGIDTTLPDETDAPTSGSETSTAEEDAFYDPFGTGKKAPERSRFATPIEGADAGPITEPDAAAPELPARKAEQDALDLGDQSVAPTTAPLVNGENQTQLGMGLDVPEVAPASAADRVQDAARAERGVGQAPMDLGGTPVAETNARRGSLPANVVGPEMAIEHWLPLVKTGEVSQQMIGYELGQRVARGDLTLAESRQIKTALAPYYAVGQQALREGWRAREAAEAGLGAVGKASDLHLPAGEYTLSPQEEGAPALINRATGKRIPIQNQVALRGDEANGYIFSPDHPGVDMTDLQRQVDEASTPATPRAPETPLPEPEATPLPDDTGTMIEPEAPANPAAPEAPRLPSRAALRSEAQAHVDDLLESGEHTPDEIRQTINEMADAGTYTDQQAIDATQHLERQLNIRAANDWPETGPTPEPTTAVGKMLDPNAPEPVAPAAPAGRGRAARSPRSGTTAEGPAYELPEGESHIDDQGNIVPGPSPYRHPEPTTPEPRPETHIDDQGNIVPGPSPYQHPEPPPPVPPMTEAPPVGTTVPYEDLRRLPPGTETHINDNGDFVVGPAPTSPTPSTPPEPPDGYVIRPDNLKRFQREHPDTETHINDKGEFVVGPAPATPAPPPAPALDTTPGRVLTVEELHRLQREQPDIETHINDNGELVVGSPPPPPSGPGGTPMPPTPPPAPPGGRPWGWPKNAPWPPTSGSIEQGLSKANQIRYATNLLFAPAGVFRDLLGTLLNVSTIVPRTGIAAGYEGAAQALGGVKATERSATFGQAGALLGGIKKGGAQGFRAAGDVLRRGTASPHVTTFGAPQGALFGDATRGQRIASGVLEAPYRLRLASDAFHANLGEEMASAGLAYRETERAGFKKGTQEFENFRTYTKQQIDSRMQQLANEAHQQGTSVPQGPARPRTRNLAPGSGPGTLKDTDVEGLAKEAFGIAKSLIFQGQAGTIAGGLGAARKGALTGPVPFFTTLANVGAQWLENHPLIGPAGTALDLVRSGGDAAGRKLSVQGPYSKVGGAGNRFTSSNSAAVRPASQRLANATIGAAVAGVGYGMVKAGLVTPPGPADTSVKRKMMDEGWRPNAIPVNDQDGNVQGYLPIDWLLGPWAGAFGFGAEQADRNERGEDLDAAAWGDILLNQSNQWAAMSGMRLLYDVFNAATAPDPDEKKRAVEGLFEDTVGSYLPLGGIMRLMNSVGDEYARDPRGLKEWFQAQIPGLRDQVPIRTTEYGNPVTRGSLATRLGNLVNPAQYAEADPGRRAYRGSTGPAQDAEVTSALNAVDNYNRHPREYKAPTNQQRALAAAFRSRVDLGAEVARTKESASRRRRGAASDSLVQDILSGNWGALTGTGGGGTGGGSDQFVPPTSGRQPAPAAPSSRFQIPRAGG